MQRLFYLDTKGPEIRTGMVDPSLNKLNLEKDKIMRSVRIMISLVHLIISLFL